MMSCTWCKQPILSGFVAFRDNETFHNDTSSGSENNCEQHYIWNKQGYPFVCCECNSLGYTEKMNIRIECLTCGGKGHLEKL